MGWGYGILPDGREVGYGVEARCDEPGCDADIDRGLGYLCGSMHGQDDGLGCGKYFCERHLLVGGPNTMCYRCSDEYEALEDEDEDVFV